MFYILLVFLTNNIHKQLAVEDKIIQSIGKLASVWRTLLWDSGRKHCLTPLQIQILMYLNKHNLPYPSITRIAKEFNLAKPTITEAVHSLERKKITYKVFSRKDKRVMRVFLTAKGKKIVEKLRSWNSPVRDQLKLFPYRAKETVMVFLMDLIASLKQSGIIHVAKICVICGNFVRNAYPRSDKPHYCHLRDRAMTSSQIRYDCENFVEKKIGAA